jgi:protoporphyrinogen oxidase
MRHEDVIIGAGMTGLAAGMVSGCPVYEAAASPGGICSSYYMLPDSTTPLPPDADAATRAQAYRFEIGGGHWIFGGDPTILQFLERTVDMSRYQRRSSVYFPDDRQLVPYPLQYHLSHLDKDVAARAIEEMASPKGSVTTMQDWLQTYFGPTLARHFFEPFHDLYTAGLHREIAPQDSYKSPVDIGLAVRGALLDVPPTGYNTTFLYPKHGLDALAGAMSDKCDVRYGCPVTNVDTANRELALADGSRVAYRNLLSTMPLNVAVEMSGVEVAEPPDPHTSVLVLNIGGTRGARCPDDHWLYVPGSDSGFHRVGFYSNVDDGFLPEPSRASSDRVSIYVERAFAPGNKPTDTEIERYCSAVAGELEAWGFVKITEVVHPTWIDVAYTWSRPGSAWRPNALAALQEAGIFQIGRYGRWMFQGIADSIRDGFAAGSSFGSSPD